MERQLRENGVEACRSSSRRKYASFARFGYLSVCQPFMRYNQIKKDLSSRGRARSGRRKSLFDTTGKAFPDADRASFVHRKSGFRPSENLFQAHHTKKTEIWNNKKQHRFRTDSAMPFLFYSFQTVKIFYFSHSLSIHAKQLRRHGGKVTYRPQADLHQSPRAVTSSTISRATAAMTAALTASVSAESFMKTVM